MWWNAVSNTATCGTAGNTRRASRMPATFTGLCSGASGLRASISPSDRVVDHHGFTEPLAAMDHSMPDHGDFRRLANDPGVLGRQLA